MKITSQLTNTGFWQPWLEANRKHAIYHQWQQLEQSGCIDNFRILAGTKKGFRQGWFFADSDAFKWLDAASRVYAHDPAPELNQLIDDFITLIEQTQDSDGYIYTYNQLLFPDKRWTNLQIEHELYCHGHLIEAGVSHYQATGDDRLLDIARKAADCIVTHFAGGEPELTPGHQEIEIALLRLYEATQHEPYLDLAEQFILLRGKIKGFPLKLVKQFMAVGKREKLAKEGLRNYQAKHGQDSVNLLPPTNYARHRLWTDIRWILNSLQGKYFQQHQPLEEQVIPVGHAVRYTYLQTAAAKLCQIKQNPSLEESLKRSWKHMVERRMYVTGGIGSLPAIEGFGRDYELDPEFAYAETCAAIGSIYWNWEMSKLTQCPQYADLLEWQLYNAALAGMGQFGKCYLYNNPLASHGKIERRAWYEVPCCPSNLTRTWERLQEYILSVSDDTIFVQQFISSSHTFEDGTEIIIDSALPYQGEVTIQIQHCPSTLKLKIRRPSWSTDFEILRNGAHYHTEKTLRGEPFQPNTSGYILLTEEWQEGETITFVFDLPVRVIHAHPNVKSQQGKVVLTRGPIVYCLESCDQPEVDLFEVVLDPPTITEKPLPVGLGEGVALEAISTNGKTLTFIPYHLWANRGESQMTVWVNYKE
ncbi:MAG: beta-L-arabinofuranosidase domain-containing protein [Anaerolineae bacterium]|jgi:DUF1680 family protein|nr:beta-L-arabinofuranosidase domain-containing protein [Anaerolineae bacterium]